VSDFLATLNRLLRSFSLYGAEDPITSEIEQAAHFEQNLALMIRARWVFTAMGVLYALVTALICYRAGLYTVAWELGYPLLVLFFLLVAYNGWYQYSYRWFSHLRGLCQLQMLVDVCFILFVIHYTGGVVSWVWIVYPLLVIESSLVFDRSKDTWLIAISCIVLYGFLLGLEFSGVIPQVRMPFYIYERGYGLKLSLLFSSWVAFVIICSALVSNYMMRLQRANQGKLKKMIIRDHLTGLYNRKHFFYSLNSEIERGRRFGHIVSVLLLDIDNFKPFNDTFGHLEGDKLLAAVANILKQTIKTNHGLVSEVDMPFRYGGDEFAILLPETTPSSGVRKAERLKDQVALEGVLQVAERIRHRIQEIYLDTGRITISIGVASYPLHGNEVEDIVRAADKALYAAKHAGKNTVALAEDEWTRTTIA